MESGKCALPCRFKMMTNFCSSREKPLLTGRATILPLRQQRMLFNGCALFRSCISLPIPPSSVDFSSISSKSRSRPRFRLLATFCIGCWAKRLAEWAAEDAKSSTTVQFDELYPSPDSRVKLLSSLTAVIDRNQLVPVERVQHLLDTLLPTPPQGTKAQLASQALRTFQSAGLVNLDAGNFELSLRSFEDFCRGYALADVIQAEPDKLKGVNHANGAPYRSRRPWYADSGPWRRFERFLRMRSRPAPDIQECSCSGLHCG